MRETFTYGSVGGAPGNRCFYPELSSKYRFPITQSITRRDCGFVMVIYQFKFLFSCRLVMPI
jgi:hypothetical protein